MNSHVRAKVLFAALLSSLLLPSLAGATPNFPGAIRENLGASEAPDCSVCHNGQRTRGTVTTAFGSAMRQRGLEAYDEASLKAALEAMTRDRVDSNGDGQIDTEALKAGKNPNSAGQGTEAFDFEEGTKPTYGCVGSVAPGPPGGAPAVALGLGMALVLARVRRRR